MQFKENDSITSDNRIRQLQRKREAIEKQTEMRKREIEQHQGLDFEKIQKENEMLIADKYNVEQRAVKLQEWYEGLKINVMKQVGQIKMSSDGLNIRKQNIYEHMIKHKSKEADLFLACTNTKPKNYFQVLEDNHLQGPLVQEKEKEMEALRIQNEILKNQLEIHKNQQEYIKEYSNNPHVDQELIKNMISDNYNIGHRVNTSKNDRSSSQLSMEAKQIMDSYIEKNNQSQKEQLQFA